MGTTKKLSLDDIFGKASTPASSKAVKSIDDIFGQKEAVAPEAPYGTMTDEIRGVSHAPADLIGASPQPAIIGENELQKNRAGFEKELKSTAGAIQPAQDSFKPMSADAFKVGGDVTMPGDIDKPKSLSQTVQSEINKRWGGDLQSIIDKARSVNPENVNLAEDMESHFWKVMKDKVPSDSFITQEDLDGFKFTRDYSNGDKDIEYSFGHYTYPQEVVNEYVARHNDEVLHNMRFKEEPEYRNEWFLRNVGVTEQAYRDKVAADLENRLQELRKKVVATLPAQHTRGGYAAIGAAANKPSSLAPVSIEKIDKALKTVNTLRKNSFFAGLKEGFDLADILTLGVSGIGENVALLNALNKSASGKTLTTAEQSLVEAWDIQNEAEEVMQVLGGRSLASNIGRGGAQSLGFITQTVGTGGLASAATKGITRAAAKSALKRVASTGVASKIKEGVRYGSLKAAESLVGAAARTPFMGFTYQNYTDKRLNQFQVNERVDKATGEISKYIDKQESSALRDAAHAALESYFESQSEDVGGLIDFGITSFARLLPINQFIRSSVVNGMTGAVKSGAIKWIKESAKIYGLAGEVLSEAYGDAAVNLLTSNTDGWKQMASSEYWWELLGVSSMLSGGFGVVNRAVNSYSGRNLDRQIAHEDNNRRNALSRIEDDMLKKELTEVSLTDDLIERSKMLSSLDWSNFTKEDMANTIDFISAQTRLDVMRESATESRRLARIMPAIDEVKTLADNGALDEDQAAASLAVIYSDLFRTQENQRALNILTDRIKVAADAGISADEINEILRGAGLTVFNPGDEIETLTGDHAIVNKVLPGAYEVVNNEGDRAVVSFEEVLQNTPEVRQIQQGSNQTEGQTESVPEINPQVEQAVADARTQVAEIINKDDNAVYEVETDDGITGYIIGGKGIVVDNDGRINQSAEDTVVVKTDEGNRVVHKERVKVKNHQTLQEIEDLARGAAEGALAAVQPQQPVGGKTYQGIYDNEPVTITLPREIKFNEDGTVDYDNLMNPETVSVIRPNGAVVDEVGLNEIEQLTEAQPEAEQVSADAPAVEQQEVANLEPDFSAIRPVSIGDFGPIYDQFRGNAKDAIALLLQRKDGEAVGALSHPEVGEIDLVWGREGTSKSDGYGLSKLAKYHPEVLGNLQELLSDMKVTSRTENRVQLESDTHRASVRLTWNEQKKNWLLTAFEKKEASASIGKTTDTDDNPKDLRGDTALSQNADALSANKDTTSEPNNQEVAQKNVTETTPIGQQPQIPLLKNGEPDYNAMDARMFAEQYVTRFGEGATERIARNNIKASNKTISTIEKQIEDVTDPNKMPALYSKLQDAQATKDKYSAVLEELGLSADESEDNAARVQRKKQENTPWFNKLFPDGFPNVESVILWDIANGNRIRWTNKEVNGAVVSKGLGSHLGLADSNAERTRRVALIGKDAPTPEEYAEQLPERLNAMGIRFEEGELRDKVLDVYASVDTIRKAKEELETMSANMNAEQEGLDYEEEQMRRNYEREQEALRQEAQAEVKVAQTEQEQPTNEETQEEELSIEDEVPFMISGNPLASETTESIMDSAKNEFEETDDWSLTGWLLPDGTQLSFSDEGGFERDIDHRAIGRAYSGSVDERWKYMQDFEQRGGIRVSMNYGSSSIELSVKPTLAQFSKLSSFVREAGGNVDIDFMDENYNTSHSVSYDSVKSSRVLSDIERYFDEGIKPSGNVSFEIAESRRKNKNEAQQLATEAAITALEDAGVEVVNATPEMVEEALRRNNAIWRKEKAPETAEQSKKTTIPTAISSASSAKVIKNLDILATEYEERPSNRARTFLGDVSGALEIPKSGKKSRYKVFEAVNGVVFAIRLSDHNATVKNFDDHNEDYGISIVVTGKPNTKIANDGEANIVEFFYSEKELRKADGKPLAQIIRSIQQALFSGVYEDTTGLAEIEEVNDQFDIRAYHGSGAKFDAFDHSYMGTGEGAQAFGWGTYVSEVFGIGKRYAEERRRRNPYEYKLKNAETDYSLTAQTYKTAVEEMPERRQRVRELEAEYYTHTETLKELRSKYGEESPEYRNYLFYNEDWDDRIQQVRKSLAQGEEYLKHITQAFLDAAERLDSVRRLYDAAQGDVYLYEVSIPDDNSNNYLPWDDVVPDEVVDFLRNNLNENYGTNLGNNYFHTGYPKNGEYIYKSLSKLLNGDKAASEFLNKNGYVGIKYPSQYTTGGRKDGSSNYVIFNPSDVEIVHTTEFSIGPAPVFVSNAKIAVLGIKQEKATPEQWLKMIEKAGGLKAGEDKWIGLSDWLKASDKKTLTKQEVLDYINENQIQIEEVEYGDIENNPRFKELQAEYQQVLDENDRNDGRAFDEMVERYGDDFGLAFSGYGNELHAEVQFGSDAVDYFLENHSINETRRQYTTDGLENKREIALTVPNIESWHVTDEIHFGDAGEGRAIAWARFGETTDSDGKRVLVIDEIQSKRHQEGRERGYRFEGDVDKARADADSAYRKVVSFENEMAAKYGDQYWTGDATDEEVDYFGRLQSEWLTYEDLANKQLESIPEAPFEKNWAELAMKRMLRYAAENGFDKVAWTKGNQQAERYNLSKSIDYIEAKRNENGTYDLDVATVDDSHFVEERGISETRLSELVGKEIALSIVKETQENKDGKTTIEGDGLRIGGEGMRAFYDQMLPSFMRKYGKKWGAAVQDVTLPYVEEAGRTMHSVDVTESMRESVMQGQPMFYRRPNGTVYGWTNGTTVYLTESGMNPNTPIHEYTHIWADAMRKHNPEGWASIVKLLKGTPVWNEVMADTNYANIHGDENKVASEALSRISGRENSAKMEAMAQLMIDENANDTVKKNRARKLLDRMRKALQEFWSWVGKELFGIKNFERIEQVTDRILYDLVSGTDLNPVSSFGTSAAERTEEVASNAQKIADKFGLSNEIVVAETQDDYIREIKSEGIPDEYINPESNAVYMPSGRIVVNAEIVTDPAELSDSIMHEIAHSAIRGGDMLYRLQDTVLEVGEERFEAAGREIFGQTIDPLVVADEIISNFVGSAANPSLFDGSNLAGEYVDGKLPFDQIYDLIIGVVTEELRVNYTDVLNAVKPYVKEVLDTIKTNHNGPKETRRVRVASRENREAQVDAINGSRSNADNQNVQTRDTSKTAPEQARGFRTAVQGYAGGQKTREDQSNDESVLQDRGADSAEQTVRVGNDTLLEGVNEFSVGPAPVASESQEQTTSDQENTLTSQEDKAKDKAKDKALKQLDHLNKVINSLRQTVKQAERDNVDLANVVQAALEGEVKDGGINRFLDVPELISLIRSGLDKKSIESTMDRLSERLTDAIIKNREEQLAQLLQVQVQGTNAFGIPIGYAVDDETRAMVEFFRENLSRDMKKIVETMENADEKFLQPYNKSELNVWFTAYKEIEESRYNIKATQKDIDHETERSQSFYRLTKELKAKNASESQIKTAQEHRRQALRNKKAQKKAILVAKQTLAQELEGMIFLLGGRLRDGRAIRAGRLSADKVYAKNLLTEAMADVRVNDGTKTYQGTKEQLEAKAKFHKDIRVRTSAYRSYAYMIQSISRNAIGGKGFLWNALMEGKNGWVDCNNKRLAMDDIDNQEILAHVQASGLKSVADLQRLFDKQLVDKNGNPYVFRYETDRTGRIDQDIRPTIGWATYIVLCFEQDDMAPTMEKMRITEEQVQQIRDMLPEAAKEFLKWSREMLSDRRQRIYNPASLERFGTQMANIPNYFPIRRLEKNLHKVEEVEQVASADSDQVTIMANALIKRVRNVVEIDFQQNPLELLKKHFERMNGFAANVPLARNVNILLNSSGFRDQLNEQGDPNTYEYFKAAAKVALSSYKPKPGALDSVMIELQGWLAAGKIAWRFFTALKQLLSIPAFWTYNISPRYKVIFIRSVLWPAVKNGDEGKLVAMWKWGMDNIPQLKERWSSRYAGNEKLAQVKETLTAQFIAKHALLRKTVGRIGEWGMIPNAAVDLFACSIGCYAVYTFELEQLQKKGYSKEEADELAKRRASIAFNESQQSSEAAFIAPLQRDRTFLAVQVSLFNNSNFGYGRKEKLARKYLWQQTFNKDLREKQLALAKRRYLERFLNEERNRLVENNNKIADVDRRLRSEEIDRMVESKRAEFSKRAEKEANRDAKMTYAKGVEDVVMFKWLLNMAWQMAPTAVAYWLSCAMREGDDEDPQNPLNAETLALMFATATFRNAIGGGVLESALNGYGFTGLVGSEVEKTVDILAQALQPLWLTDEEAESFDPLAVWMAVKQCLVMGTGFDVNVYANFFTGLVGLFNDRSRTTADVLRILNAPKSMIREIEIIPFEDETLDNYTRRMAMMENVALDRMEELKGIPSSELNASELKVLRKMKKWEKNLITIRQAEAADVPYSREADGRVVAPELKQLDADYTDLLKSLDLTQSGKNRAGKVELTEDERRRKKALRVVTRVKGIRTMEESAAEVINNPEAYRNAYRQIVEEKRKLIEEWNQ